MNPVEQKIALQLGVLQLQIAQMAAKIDELMAELERVKGQRDAAEIPALHIVS